MRFGKGVGWDTTRLSKQMQFLIFMPRHKNLVILRNPVWLSKCLSFSSTLKRGRKTSSAGSSVCCRRRFVLANFPRGRTFPLLLDPPETYHSLNILHPHVYHTISAFSIVIHCQLFFAGLVLCKRRVGEAQDQLLSGYFWQGGGDRGTAMGIDHT